MKTAISEIKRIPETEISAYAGSKAARIMVDNEWRPTMGDEAALLEAAICGGILSARARLDGSKGKSAAWDTIHTAADSAEYAMIHLFSSMRGVDVNTYYSVYNPVLDWFRDRGIEC